MFYQEQLRNLLKINQKSCPFVKYIDNYTVKYLGKGLIHSDVASVQTLKPVSKDDVLFYFEVKIIDIGQRGDLSIGLADGNFPSNKHPGYAKNSYGYKADGKTYTNKTICSNSFPKFTSEDIVGCGLNFLKKEIFFTHNGVFLGAPFKNVEILEFFPTIGLHSQHESIKFVFDAKFDVISLKTREIREIKQEIASSLINPFEVHRLVQSYLYYHGYYETLSGFEKICQLSRENAIILEKTPKKPAEIEEIHEFNGGNAEESKIEEEFREENREINESLSEKTRQKDRDLIAQLVRKGEILKVFEALQANFPKILENTEVLLALHAQQFLELVKNGEIQGAIELAQNVFPGAEEQLLDFFDESGKIIQIKLEDIMGILCYEKPENCGIGYLLHEKQREILFEKLNAEIFDALCLKKRSVLEGLVCHYHSMIEKNSDLSCYLGKIFDFSC